jgi:pyocin large subunit-like protein
LPRPRPSSFTTTRPTGAGHPHHFQIAHEKKEKKMSDQPEQKAPVVTVAVAEYEPPTAVRTGTLVSLAAGTYSEGQQDDGDYHTTKWHA